MCVLVEESGNVFFFFFFFFFFFLDQVVGLFIEKSYDMLEMNLYRNMVCVTMEWQIRGCLLN